MFEDFKPILLKIKQFRERLRAEWIRRNLHRNPFVVFFTRQTGESTRQRWIRRSWKLAIFIFLSIVIYFQILQHNIFNMFGVLPSIEKLENPKIPTASELYTADGVLIGRYYRENRTPVTYDKISPHLVKALIATEDIRFKDHSGIDLRAMVSLLWYNLKGDRRGGSTITQQLAKNLFKTREGSDKGWAGDLPLLNVLASKSKEWIVAIKLERAFTKEEIITLYLNTVDFGSNAFGIYTASKTFFSTSPENINAQQAAALVGLLKAPTYYSPIKNPQNCLRRRNTVFGQMVKYNFLTVSQADSLSNTKLGVKFYQEKPEDGAGTYFRGAMNSYFNAWCNANGYDLYADGLKIYTTIDSRMQKLAEEAVAERMELLQGNFYKHWKGMNPWRNKKGEEIPNYIEDVASKTEFYKLLSKKYNGDKTLIMNELNKPKNMKVFSWRGEIDTVMSSIDSIKYYKHFLHSGLIAMDPHIGHIKAWVGGINYKYFKYDNVKQARRQPGSTFKPFVFAAAIDSFGYSPCSKLRDSPVTIRYEEEGVQKYWSPHNADWTFSYDTMTIRHGMGRSLNTITAKMTQLIGWQAIANYAKRLGITSPMKVVPSIGLGSNEVTLYEMVGAYSAFVNEGLWIEPIFVTRIEDKNGRLVHRFIPKTRQALTPESAFLMVYMLKGSLQEPGGTSGRLYSFPKLFGGNELGGKTGTSSNHADGWYMGITKDLVAGAWVGGDDRSIHFRSGEQGEGSKTALPIFGTFLEKVYADTALGVKKGTFPSPKKGQIRKPYFCPTPPKPKSDSTKVVRDSLAIED